MPFSMIEFDIFRSNCAYFSDRKLLAGCGRFQVYQIQLIEVI
jgi:hypothetical protein